MIWDVRMVSLRGKLEAGPYPCNKVAFDPSGEVIAAASDDTTIKIFSAVKLKKRGILHGHQDTVQAVIFTRDSKYLISGGTDCAFILWQ